MALRQLRHLDALVFHYSQPDESRAIGLETEQLSGSARHIDDAPARERAAIIDAQLHGAAIIDIGYLDNARHWQCAMRRGHPVQIEDLAVCGICCSNSSPYHEA